MFGFFKKKNKKEKEVIKVKEDKPVVPQNYEYQLTLLTNGATQSKDSYDPAGVDLEIAMDTLTEDESNCLILDSKNHVKDFAFIQATEYNGAKGEVYVEAKQEKTNSDRIYYKRMPVDNLLAILKDFLQGVAPDVSEWEEM